MKEKLLNVLKIAISLGLIAYIFTRPTIRNVDWSTVLDEMQLWPWFLGMAVYFVAIGFNVLKWQLLLQTLGVRVPYANLYRHNLVGLFFALLPLSMVGGDIARGWDLARHTEGQAAPVAVSVLVDRLVGLAGFLLAAVLGLASAVVLLERPDLGWLLTTLGVVLVVYGLAFAVLMSQRLRRLVERVFRLGPLERFLPLYQRVSDSVQVYRTHGRALLAALAIQLLTVLATCVVNYLAAVAAGTDVPLAWVFVLTPLTAFAPFLPSIASGLGWNQGVFVVLYVELAQLGGSQPDAFAASVLIMSLAMQAIIIASSLPGAVLWWRRREAISPSDQLA
ncbi:MAG: flippase-like domain-containing protein [Anaerolineae bacterium]|nr:flippase-like domain-containing protein [Anaerolineae bacterium]